METNELNIFGFDWRVGRSWGIAHPIDICYADAHVVNKVGDTLVLGIEHKPASIPLVDVLVPPVNNKYFEWAVGYISTKTTIKYGVLSVDFRLPIGNHLWPAIWLTDGVTWPPEIDIMEAWSGDYRWPICKPRTPRRMYRINPIANSIFPTIHTGTNPDTHVMNTYRIFNGTPLGFIKPLEVNRCTLIWTPDEIIMFYNDHEVAWETDPDIIRYFNESKGMEIHMNNYITNDFTGTDFRQMKTTKGFTSDFCITGLYYDPDYRSFHDCDKLLPER